jgi:hypothetical protein
MTKRVYILTDGGHDYSDAERFGAIEFCHVSVKNKSDISQMYRELRECLWDSGEDDYLVISSLTSLCCVATAILTELHGRVNFLLFEGGKYIERTLVTDNDTIEE